MKTSEELVKAIVEFLDEANRPLPLQDIRILQGIINNSFDKIQLDAFRAGMRRAAVVQRQWKGYEHDLIDKAILTAAENLTIESLKGETASTVKLTCKICGQPWDKLHSKSRMTCPNAVHQQ